MKTLFGGSEQSSSTGGFPGLPADITNAFTGIAKNATNYLPSNGGTALFTPPPLNAGATTALDQLSNQAFTPNAANIKSNMAMQTNPYDQSVIDTINREAQGQGSQLNQMLTNAGQFGSNRGALSANDIDLTRLNQIGSFKNQEFQNAMNNAMTVLPQAQTQAAQGAVNAGQTQQQQSMQKQLAPISALQALSSTMGILPQTSGTSQSSGSSSPGIFSDIRLKHDIKFIKNIDGVNVYNFRYNFEPEVIYSGAIAQEINESHPEAISMQDGWMTVNYDKLPIDFGRV